MGSTCLCNCGNKQGSINIGDTDAVSVVAFMSISSQSLDLPEECPTLRFIPTQFPSLIPPRMPNISPYCSVKGDKNKVIADWTNCETDVPVIKMIKVFINGRLEIVDDLTYIYKSPVPLKTMSGYYARGGLDVITHIIIDPETKNSVIGFLPGVENDFANVTIYKKDKSKLKKIKFEIVLNNNQTYSTYGNVINSNCQTDDSTVLAFKTDLTIEPSFEADMEKISKDNPSISVFHYPIMITSGKPNIQITTANFNSKIKFRKNCRVIDSYAVGDPPTTPCENDVKTAGGDNFMNSILDNYSYTIDGNWNYLLFGYNGIACDGSVSNDHKVIRKLPPLPILTGGRTSVYRLNYFPFSTISIYHPFVGLPTTTIIGQGFYNNQMYYSPPYICVYSENYEDKKKKLKYGSFKIDCESIKNNKFPVNCEAPFIDTSNFGYLIDPDIKHKILTSKCINFTDFNRVYNPVGDTGGTYSDKDFIPDGTHWIFYVEYGPRSTPVVEESCNSIKITQQHTIYLGLGYVWPPIGSGGTYIDPHIYDRISDTGSCVDYRVWAYIIESTVEVSYESN